MAKPKFGFTYPTVTGENTPKGAAFTRIRNDFPKMQLWSVYYDSSDLPSWNEKWFEDVEANANLIYLISIKSSNVTAIGDRMGQMPQHIRGRVLLFLHHEPDQWRSASDPRSDPDPTTWKNRQQDFCDYREGKPWETWVELWVCFTEDRYRTDTAAWENNWGNTIDFEPRIEGVAFDCFNIGRSVTRAGADIFKKPLEFARREGRRLIIREYGQVTPVDSPEDSHTVADQIDENWEYAKIQNEVDDVFFGLVWYYNHNNTLADPNMIRRPLTQAVLQEIIEEAATPRPDDPDPEDPQYRFGFEAGWQARQEEVNGSKALGRSEAFGEVAAWAAQQS